ncbi:MAG: bifunctional phosphoribosylaminoimidazolecarboxamide formyltransferase/IMP cyclohydrolase [Thermodesulfobacteriota bacterium]|nr:bifunctional phosphoribosylaminoimidazolecarboxamide formyltransferase/IMP cyclohydrolase [Thermodesulfobacteriota bacterium]
MAKIKRALISVSDKKGIEQLAKSLNEMGVEILSTGGTASLLKKGGSPILSVSEYTGFPEMLDGRVKTLHPKIHGALLGIRSNEEHVKKMEEHNIKPIDMVIVNLYPFEETIAKEGCTLKDAIENIDIGGPTMLRSAAKNYNDVTVIIDPEDYDEVLKEMKEKGGNLSSETNFRLALKVFQTTAKYDGAISNYLGSLEEKFPKTLSLQFEKSQDLRYGENPHQKAAFYKERDGEDPCVSNAIQLQGKELSFNNMLDLDAALMTVNEFEEIAAVIIKHNNPCGVAISDKSLLDAYCKAKQCDPTSAFGGVIGLNRNVDSNTAKEITSTFIEVLIAPGYDEDALNILNEKKDLRVLKVPPFKGHTKRVYDMKKVSGGLLVQDMDLDIVDFKSLEVVTKRKPTEEDLKALRFAWRVCKHVKSNAIVFTTSDQVVGIGAGQMSRVDSSNIAVMKACLPTEGTVLASDAMFPFRDGVDAAAKAGVKAIIQPGGSIRDEEIIEAANEHNIAMVFTKMRHFKH